MTDKIFVDSNEDMQDGIKLGNMTIQNIFK